jgi:hypothetical protein
MEAVRTSETSVNSYQSTGRYNPKDSHLHIIAVRTSNRTKSELIFKGKISMRQSKRKWFSQLIIEEQRKELASNCKGKIGDFRPSARVKWGDGGN